MSNNIISEIFENLIDDISDSTSNSSDLLVDLSSDIFSNDDSYSSSEEELTEEDLLCYREILFNYNIKSDINIETIDVIKNKNCPHYMNYCMIYCNDCNKKYDCWKCHNEVSDHKIERNKIEQIICVECNKKQEWSHKCKKCNKIFGKYWCNKCKIIDTFENNNIIGFHCDKCKLCLWGNMNDYIHCDKCSCCYKKIFYNNHKCIENKLDNNCCICIDKLSDGGNITHLSCGHVLHQDCFDKMIIRIDKCPICKNNLFI
jgi:hypothetical protein